MNTTKTPSQCSLSLGRDVNPEPPQYEARVPAVGPPQPLLPGPLPGTGPPAVAKAPVPKAALSQFWLPSIATT
jgi:hypothetical protein